MPYRTDLKRPDLKGQFPCTVCHKIFCHSSSLSRHRMQAHYKCYICTQCNQEIHSSETLRSHMYRCHQIHRMFMCRCCNWAFPDKTSLHIHMQSMQKSGKPGDVSVLARSSLEVSGAGDDSERAHSLGSPTNSSPDEEHQYRGESISPSISEMEMDEQQHADYEHQNLGKQEQILSRVKLENEDTQQQQHQTARTHQNNAGIFPNQLEAPAAEFLLSKFGIKSELATTLEDKANYQNAHHQHHDKQHQQQLNLLNVVGQSNPNPSFALSPAATLLQQQPWLGQMLANNPYFTASAIDKTGTTSLMSAYHHQQQHGPPPNNNSKVIQTFCAALASAAAAAAASKANSPQAASVNLQSAGVIAQHQQPSPPQKKPRKSDKRRGTSVPTNEDLRLQIPQQQSPLIALSPAMSEGSTTAGKLNSLISNLLSIRSCTDGSQGSPLSGNGEDGKCPSSAIGSDRKNKRKMRTPTRSEMTEIIYGDEPEGEEDEMPKKSADMLFPCIQSFMEKSQPSKGNNNAAREQQNSDQQPSPAVSDSQTSGSCHSHTEAGGHMLMDGGCGALISPKKCESCQIFDGGPTELHKTTVHMIGRIAERITKLSDSVEENKAKEGLLDCAKQLRDIVDRH